MRTSLAKKLSKSSQTAQRVCFFALFVAGGCGGPNDPCESVSCPNDGVCSVVDGAAICPCPAGFVWDVVACFQATGDGDGDGDQGDDAGDAGALDGGLNDAGDVDSGAVDGGGVDAGAVDAGGADGGVADDAGVIDCFVPPLCGNAILDDGELCDPGLDPTNCNAECVVATSLVGSDNVPLISVESDTFGSFNQRMVVANDRWFVGVREGVNAAVLESRDFGKTWTTLYGGVPTSQPPVVDVDDETGQVFVMFRDDTTSCGRFLRFDPPAPREVFRLDFEEVGTGAEDFVVSNNTGVVGTHGLSPHTDDDVGGLQSYKMSLQSALVNDDALIADVEVPSSQFPQTPGNYVVCYDVKSVGGLNDSFGAYLATSDNEHGGYISIVTGEVWEHRCFDYFINAQQGGNPTQLVRLYVQNRGMTAWFDNIEIREQGTNTLVYAEDFEPNDDDFDDVKLDSALVFQGKTAEDFGYGYATTTPASGGRRSIKMNTHTHVPAVFDAKFPPVALVDGYEHYALQYDKKVVGQGVPYGGGTMLNLGAHVVAFGNNHGGHFTTTENDWQRYTIDLEGIPISDDDVVFSFKLQSGEIEAFFDNIVLVDTNVDDAYTLAANTCSGVVGTKFAMATNPRDDVVLFSHRNGNDFYVMALDYDGVLVTDTKVANGITETTPGVLDAWDMHYHSLVVDQHGRLHMLVNPHYFMPGGSPFNRVVVEYLFSDDNGQTFYRFGDDDDDFVVEPVSIPFDTNDFVNGGTLLTDLPTTIEPPPGSINNGYIVNLFVSDDTVHVLYLEPDGVKAKHFDRHSATGLNDEQPVPVDFHSYFVEQERTRDLFLVGPSRDAAMYDDLVALRSVDRGSTWSSFSTLASAQPLVTWSRTSGYPFIASDRFLIGASTKTTTCESTASTSTVVFRMDIGE